jgi:Leucine-rich repeat (LRR) protein
MELYDRLIETYTQENLNKITHKLVEAYRTKNFSYLNRLASSIQESIPAKADKINKLFSQLVMLYHPDRLEFYKKEIARHHTNGEIKNLKRFSHIFQILEEIDKTGPIPSESQSVYSDQNESDWYGDAVDWNAVIYDEAHERETFESGVYDFISALKEKEYGNLDVVYRKQDLANTEGDLELSGYNIRDLSGLEFCTNIVTLDLSNNLIHDITHVGYLHLLEELDLSFNQISQIDVLSELEYLKILDLSFNQIKDIRSLLGLNHLEYVNLVGNEIPKSQIETLHKKRIVVVH